MHSRGKRVVWLLNHTTLMKAEVSILMSMGYEVFTPKVIPTVENNIDFRTCVVDFSYDKSLTIPGDVLKVLNETNLYTEEWPSDVVEYINTYFSAIFVVPISIPLVSSLKFFKGAILLRAFGLESRQTYARLMQYLNRDSLRLIYAARDRFWFAAGYQQLCEVEPKLISKRNVYLPVALPSSFDQHARTWTGGEKQILFVCPHIETNDYYKIIYQNFKRDFGDLPHVIIGKQDVSVDDPHVLGFVPDDRHIELLQKSSLLYYHSHEPRHVHYPPIEAAKIGIPVVFHQESLLARMLNHLPPGAIGSTEQARRVIELILQGDQQTIDAIRNEQQTIVDLFSESRCLEVWQKSFSENGISDFLKNSNESKLIENNPSPYCPVPLALLRDPKLTVDSTSTLEDGIYFSKSDFPEFVEHISGVDIAEKWGAWSHGELIEIEVVDPINGMFEMDITGGAYGENIGAAIEIQVGTVWKRLEMISEPWNPTTVTIRFFLTVPVKTIKIRVPHPTRLPGQDRYVGVGLQKIRVRPFKGTIVDWFLRRSIVELNDIQGHP
jgi:hypothetical protein